MLTRVIENAVLPTAQRHRMGVVTYGPLSSGWLSGRTDPGSGHRARGREAKDFDLAKPANRSKLEAVEQFSNLAKQSGIELPYLATTFVLTHPGVSSVLIGPRTLEQLQSSLRGVSLRLDSDILDAIDEMVPPGTELNPADNH